ncbi:MAG: NAD-dependent epimerase/dehydratase family protein [Candidatus Paceibacterota bacterium]|jgi:CDP-paratose 2-epimerase
MEYKHILITGGCGFVGSSLAIRLKEKYPQSRITTIDNLSRKGSELNKIRLLASGIECIEGDVRHAETFTPFDSVDLIFDCAAEPSVLAGKDGSPLYALETNLWGTVNVLELSRRTNAKIMFTSSSRVYPVRELNEISIVETDTRFMIAPDQTISGVTALGISEKFPIGVERTLYGATKLASEMLINEYALLYGTQAIINRCGVIAGPWQFGKVDQGVAVLWMARHVFQKQKLSYIGWGGEGKQVRDFLHPDDLFDALSYQLDHFDACVGNTFNLGGGTAHSASLKELTRICEKISGHTIIIDSVSETRWGDVKLYISDSSRFEKLSGWKPKRGVEIIMNDIHEWLISHKDMLAPIFT